MKFIFACLLALLPVVAATQVTAQQGATQQTNCIVNPGACQAPPVPSTCAPGHHWTLMGSGIAHCVADDPVCPGGTELTHDWLGNPSCFVLIVESDGRHLSCPSGQVGGGISQERTKTTHADGSATYGSWHTTSSDCATPPPAPDPDPPVTNPDPPTTNPNPPVANPDPSTDPKPGVCSNGASNYPTCTLQEEPKQCPNGATDYPTCTPPPPAECKNGATNPPACNAFPACSNGALNPPQCTEFLEQGCYLFNGTLASIGTVTNSCAISYTPFPSGETYRCTLNDWQQNSPGRGDIYNDCE